MAEYIISWDNLVTCNLSYIILLLFKVKGNITNLLFSQAISNYDILLSEVKLYYVAFSQGILHKSPFLL